MEQVTSKSLCSYAQEMLAYTLCSLFPNAIYVRGSSTNVDFFCDFVLPQQLPQEMIDHIEYEWRKTLKDSPAVETFEMMRENAADFLTHKGQPFRADEALDQPDGVISLIKLGEFFDLKPFSLEEFSEVSPKILNHLTFEEGDAKITRIEGTASKNAQSLKQYVKLRKAGEKKDYVKLGVSLGLFEHIDQELIFLPRGESLRQILISYLTKLAKEENYLFVRSLSSDFFSQRKFGEGIATWKENESTEEFATPQLIATLPPTVLNISSFAEESKLIKNCISSLQFIEKTIKIFDLTHEWILCDYRTNNSTMAEQRKNLSLLSKAAEAFGLSFKRDSEPNNFISPRIELRLYDAKGREWTSAAGLQIPLVYIEEKRAVLSLGSIECLIAFLLERTAGELPFWLLPEQVRVLSVDEKNEKRVKEIKLACIKEGLRSGIDLGKDELSEKVGLALQHKVPFILVVGEQEEKDNVLSVRALGEAKSSRMKLEEFLALTKPKLTDLDLP